MNFFLKNAGLSSVFVNYKIEKCLALLVFYAAISLRGFHRDYLKTI